MIILLQIPAYRGVPGAHLVAVWKSLWKFCFLRQSDESEESEESEVPKESKESKESEVPKESKESKESEESKESKKSEVQV